MWFCTEHISQYLLLFFRFQHLWRSYSAKKCFTKFYCKGEALCHILKNILQYYRYLYNIISKGTIRRTCGSCAWNIKLRVCAILPGLTHALNLTYTWRTETHLRPFRNYSWNWMCACFPSNYKHLQTHLWLGFWETIYWLIDF